MNIFKFLAVVAVVIGASAAEAYMVSAVSCGDSNHGVRIAVRSGSPDNIPVLYLYGSSNDACQVSLKGRSSGHSLLIKCNGLKNKSIAATFEFAGQTANVKAVADGIDEDFQFEGCKVNQKILSSLL